MVFLPKTLGPFSSLVRAAIHSESLAINILRSNNWNLERAIEYVFAEGAEYSTIKPAVLEKIYKVYKDADEDLIMAEGIGQFCNDLGVDPSDPITLVISR